MSLIPAAWCALALQNGTPVLHNAAGQTQDVRQLQQNMGFFECPPIILCYRQFTLARCGITPDPQLTVCDLDELALLADIPLSSVLTSYTQPTALFAAANTLLTAAAKRLPNPQRVALLLHMQKAGSAWAPLILQAAGMRIASDEATVHMQSAFAFVQQLPERADPLPRLASDDIESAVPDNAVLTTLQKALGSSSEQRAGQRDYAALVNKAMQPAEHPCVVLAEAETGTGKTAGYLAAAVARARSSERPVLIATYTKALQRQAERETARFYASDAERRQHVVVRKGRENYLCLLKYADTAAMPEVLQPAMRGALALLGWCLLDGVHDGDLSDLAPRIQAIYNPTQPLTTLSDKRGECLHNACSFYKRCFIERVQAAARRAHIVIANHALVLHSGDSNDRLGVAGGRLIFDEAHRLFDAADAAYATTLGLNDLYELRRRLRGSDARALVSRLEPLLSDFAPVHRDAILEDAQKLLLAADALPQDGCLQRLRSSLPAGALEEFFTTLYQAALRVHTGGGAFFDMALPAMTPQLTQHTQDALQVLTELADAGSALLYAIETACDDSPPPAAERLGSFMRLYDETLRQQLPTYVAMLQRLLPNAAPPPPEAPATVDFMEVAPLDARLFDVTLRRHLLNPAQAFADRVLRRAAGTVITSATLRDDAHRETIEQGAWRAAEQRTGADAAILPALRASFPSPFVYARNARVFVVQGGRSMNSNDIACANAFTQLSLATGGGALGIFTAIARVRQVYMHSQKALEQAGYALYAQHVHGADVSLCADLFRDDENSCLIGTDAVRDGLDVPGRALRLVVCDKIPYPRPTYLHLQRREAFGGFSYDRMLIRMRLKQAFGRLIRCASDKGAFVMLDDRGDAGLWSWLPEGVKVERLPLEKIVQLLPECV